MIIRQFVSAKQHWLLFFFSFLMLAHIPMRVYGVDIVPAGTYVTFSTVYNGKRYYLGVDTVKVNSGTDTVVAAFDKPNYATMWTLGEERGAGAGDYLRTIKNVWLKERKNKNKFLSVQDASTYGLLVISDTAQATLWTTANDERVQSKYTQGFLYHYAEKNGLDVYRYLTYDPLYGFGRLYSTRPSVSQRMSVWDRKTGNDVTCTMTPPSYSFGLNTTEDTTRLVVTSHVYYYTGVDRFRSRYDQMDIYVTTATVYDNQDGLTKPPYDMFGYYEWASNPRKKKPTVPANLTDPTYAYDGHSLMPVYVDSINHNGSASPEDWTLDRYWSDSTVLWVSDSKYKLQDNVWYDTVFAIGKSPFDNPEDGELCRVLRKVNNTTPPIEGDYAPHSDWLRQHFYIKNPSGVYEHFVDSVPIVRRTFHNAPYTTLDISSSPNDTVIDYNESAATIDFTISAEYESGKNILYANNSVAQRVVEEEDELDLTTLAPTTVNDTLYNGLIVEALMIDGTNAIVGGEGATAASWITSVTVVDRNVIRVEAKPMTVDNLNNRTAQIRYSYRYRHSSVHDDWAECTRSIWITQKGYSSTSANLYTFHHKDGDDSKLQPVHEKKQTFYAIPEQNLQLLLHRDHWGYYRWFIYDENKRDKDLLYNSTWSWGSQPKNAQGTNFMEINHTSDASSRGRWDVKAGTDKSGAFTNHFTVGTATSIPSLTYQDWNAKTGMIACDVSAYYDINTHDSVIGSLTALTEPTLSYRQIIDVHPAKEQADTLANYRYLGDGDGKNPKWMETHKVIVPAGRPFSLIQRYPVINGSSEVVERDHLQYIYYFNTGNSGADMGLKGALDDTKKGSYSRVGEKRTVSLAKRLRVLTKQDLDNMTEGQTKKVILVNPRKISGYAVGRSGDEGIAARDWASQSITVNDTADLRTYLMSNRVLGYSQCEIVLTKSADQGYFSLSQSNRPLYNYRRVGQSYIMRWISGDEDDVTGDKWIRYDDFSGCDDDSRVEGCNFAEDGTSPTFFKLHMNWTKYWGWPVAVPFSQSGYITACTWVNVAYPYGYYEPNFNVIDGDGNSGTYESNQGWMLYEILEAESTDYEEIPRWEKSANGTSGWTEVARKETDNSNYRMMEDGNLRISATTHTSVNETIYYRLRTEHFQLAKYMVVTRNAAIEGPSTSAIITEDSIQNHFDILYTLGNDRFPAPNTSDVKAFYHTLPWGWTEMSYHYPRSVIPDEDRVFATDLPAAGEYAYLNKFTLNGHTTEAMAGAEIGYMLCIHAAQKPMTIFNFTYPQLPCSDQNIYLTFNLSNPVPGNSYNPQVTCELQGKVGEGEWRPLHRFKTGGVTYEGDDVWQQFVLPIPQTTIADQDSFRCVAQLTGSTYNDAYLLIDRMRFIAKQRPVSVFQHKGACLASEEGGNVDIVARLDYKHASYPAGTHIAFQYQKKDGSDYTRMSGITYVNEHSEGEDDWGVLTIPAASHVPNSDSVKTVNALTENGMCYVNEGTVSQAYYVLYLSQEVEAHVRDTFRVVMARVLDIDETPNFATVGCASERIISIDNPIQLRVSECDTVWQNFTRTQLEGGAGELSIPNATYSATAAIGDGFLPAHSVPGSGKCMFDVVRTVEAERSMAGNDAWFKNRFGCTRPQFRELMMTFRKDVPENRMRLETNWNNVRPEYFRYDGRSQAQADSIYSILNRLIVDSAFIEIGVSSYDVYLGDNNNAYAVFWPIPASGTYTYEDPTSHVRETRSIPVCSTPRWFEIHSGSAAYSMRFGYDNMWAGDYYLVPVIRASRTDANSEIKVRLAEITHDGSNVAVMGYDATTIEDTNDPTWNPSTMTFVYNPDKDVRTAAEGHIAVADYYYAGGTEGKSDTIVTFRPKDGKTYSLKAGYWYKFRTPYYPATVGSDFYESTSIGYAEFIVAVAPDTVVWTPSHEGKANYWNDDNNWTPQMASMPADGFKATVPMNNTKVIIPEVEEGLLPIVSDLVVERKDTLHFGYAKNTCGKILFKPHSQMLGQEKLNYDTAYVDVLLKTGSWQTFAPALEHIYSGDMYIPFDAVSYVPADPKTGASVDTVDFAPKPFPYTTSVPALGYNPREYPFIVYQGFYNSSVHVAFYNTDKDGDPVDSTVHASKSVVDWVKTNAMDLPYTPGKACVLKGFDAWDDYSHEMVIRLPKQETSYYGYGKKNGELTVGAAVDVTRGELTHNLAYDKYATGFSSENGLSYTLTNEVESNIFFFGNPTMSLIDVYQLCKDNIDQLQHSGSSGSEEFRFTAYQLKEGSTYMPQQVTDYGQYFVAPQRAVGLIANSENTAAKSLTIKLTPNALVALTGDGKIVSHNDVKSGAPQRRATNDETIIAVEPSTAKRLYITAANETNKGVQKAYLTLGEQADASRGFVYGEDAKSLSSGDHYYNSGSFVTPLNIYTIADNEALMMDIRDTLSCVPVIFSTLDKKYVFDAYTTLSFATDGAWDRPLYLYDAVTNDSLMILNGLRVSVPTPYNNQMRYFINGLGRTASNNDQPGTTTGIEVVNEQLPITNNQSGTTVIYDVLGRRLMTLNEYDLISNIRLQLPTGVYIIQRGDKTERMVIR